MSKNKWQKPHQNSYCCVCQKQNVNHTSFNCPKGTTVYHGTKKSYADSICKNGFKASSQGSIGQGVYFTLDFSQAKSIARYKFEYQRPVVIECRAEVNGITYNKEDSEEQLLRKLNEWFNFCKIKGKTAIHSQWAGINQKFKQVCVKNPNAIQVIRVHEL